MGKHRLLSLFLVIVMMFSCTSTQFVIANAIGNPTFTVSGGMGTPGDDVMVTVDISNNPGICTATIWVHYDEGLTLKSTTDSKLLVGGIFGGNKSANPYGMYWDDSANFDGDNSSNGTLATMVFTIDENAANGDYDIWVTYKYGDIYNLNLDDFDFECVAGKITVTGGACAHKYTNYVSDGNATCQNDGTKTATCDNGCGTTDTITDVGSKAGNSTSIKVTVYDGHKYGNYISDNNATCQVDGTKTATCDNGCGKTNTITDTGSKKDHSYSNYVSNNDATCEVDGTETANCDYNCGKTDIRTDIDSKLGHKYTNYVSNNDATCQADGTKTAACDNNCGKTDTVIDVGSKTDHKYTAYTSNNDSSCEIDGTETAKCNYNCGKTDTRTDVDSKLGHDWELTSTDSATCTEDGTKHFTCKNDSAHTKDETITAPGHTYGEWTVVKGATSTEVGEKFHTCTVADCGHTETVEIPAIITEIVGVTDGVWEINKSETLSIKVDGSFGEVLEIKVDGAVVNKDSYVVNADSSTITIKAEYLNALSSGKHSITVKYADGETSTEIEVKAVATADKEDTENSDTKSPQTGDNSNTVLWIVIAFVSFAALVALIIPSRRKVNHR